MRKSHLVLGIGLLLGTANAMAEDAAPAEAAAAEAAPAEAAAEAPAAAAAPSGGGAVKYGTAGCGLGSIIFGGGTGFTQIFAATTNGSSANQTFGITSGTSNCDAAASTESAKNFVEANRVALAKDISRGKGQTLTSLSELAGCSDSKAVGAKLRKNFKRIFPNAKASDTAVSESVVGMLKSDEALSCSNLG
jgi:pyruvate/2-oxoglutarate dehydrogenase complex dihydrolipoamide acyltransferase (E2) component